MAGGVIQSYDEYAAAIDELEAFRADKKQYDDFLRIGPRGSVYPYRRHDPRNPKALQLFRCGGP